MVPEPKNSLRSDPVMPKQIITILISFLLLSNRSLAAEEKAHLNTEPETQITSASHFKILNLKCDPSEAEGPEATPQSPPLDVDDPDTPGCNHWEVNMTVDGDFAKDERHLELPLTDINYGIGDNLQLKYELPSIQTQSQDESSSGVGNAKAGIKFQFYENESNKLNMAVYPQLEMVSFGEQKGNIVILPVLISKKIGDTEHGDLMLTVNLGYNIDTRVDGHDVISVASGIGFPLSRRLSLMGEISTEQSLSKAEEAPREQLVKANIGAVGIVTRRWLMFGSLGTSLVSADGKEHLYALSGIRWLTGGL